MSRKYRNGKLNMWSSVYDTSLSREQLIAKVPDGIHKDQWSLFVDYHLRAEYQELCQKNTEIRKKQIIPHTGDSKLLSRKQNEMSLAFWKANASSIINEDS
ncbi:flocculation protein FLO1 isoform X5 [Spatholobus suberectus]|nr:flocculation protein FLO1 isoform X5 [Spatholobus suberectus]